MPLPRPGVASLPMYDFVELRAAHDALWTNVVAAFGDGLPRCLAHDDDVHALWHAGDLAVSQSCGWPLVDELDGRVRLIGAFAYDVPSANGPRYRSRLVARAATIDPARSTAAVNSFASLSGWLSLVRADDDWHGVWHGVWPGDVLVTGAHVHSLRAVQDGAADVAAIDGVTFALVERFRPWLLDGLVVIGEGPLIPCLPLIANRSTSDAELSGLQAAFAAAVDTTSAGDRNALRITAFHPLTVEDYAPVRRLHAVWQGGRR